MSSLSYTKIYIKIAAISLSFLFFPWAVKAATVYFSVPTESIYQGDIFIAEVKVSSPEELINAGEITVLFDKNKLEVRELSSGGLLFSLWMKPPIFSNEEGKASFIGGTPDGFQGEEALILKIVFLAKNEGEAKLDFQDDTSLFLHDGKGTRISPWLRPVSLNISKRPPEITPRTNGNSK